MTQPHAQEGISPELWRRVAEAPARLLMLDYDGTLAPFHPLRGEARPLPASLERVRRIAEGGRTRVAIVSGRPLREVEGFLGPLRAAFVGEHGWERRTAQGELVQEPLAPAVEAALGQAVRLAGQAGWGDQVERKRTAIVLHTRALPPARAEAALAACLAAWQPLAFQAAVAVDRIDGGLELRARGRHKGTVVEALLRAAEPGTLGVFVGDDVTDEDAFEAVRAQGFGIRVGEPDRPTLAAGSVRSCLEVPALLDRWIALTEPPDVGPVSP